MSSDCYCPERECAHDLHVILRRINVKTFPHPHRLLANAPIAIDYLSHVQMSANAFVSKPLVKEICQLWSRMKSVSQHSEYQLLQPDFSNLTLALRRAHSFFSPKWDDVSEVFEYFSLRTEDPETAHNEQARNRVMALGYTKLIAFLNEKGMSHIIRQFERQLGDDMDTELHPWVEDTTR